jgi:hypothetical protein
VKQLPRAILSHWPVTVSNSCGLWHHPLDTIFLPPFADSLQFYSQKYLEHSATALRIHDNGLVVFLKEITLYHTKLLHHMYLLKYNLAERAEEVRICD